MLVSRVKEVIKPAYDGFGNLQRQRTAYYYNDDWTALMDFEYSYNKNNRLVQEADLLGGGKNIAYTLDKLDRVNRFEGPAGNTNYFLDTVNNIPRLQTNGQAPLDMTIDEVKGLNQIESIGSRTFDYSLSGNLIADSDPPGDDPRNYHWDGQGRLVEVCSVGSNLIEDKISQYVYDALNRRVRKLIYNNQGEVEEKINYMLFSDNVMEEVHETLGGGKWMLVIFHDPTVTDNYLRWDRYNWAQGNWAFVDSFIPATDVRNNVAAMISENGAIAELIYDLYGNAQIVNSFCADGRDTTLPYRFSGRRYDSESDNYYYRSRYYTPDLARFISIDTIIRYGRR